MYPGGRGTPLAIGRRLGGCNASANPDRPVAFPARRERVRASVAEGPDRGARSVPPRAHATPQRGGHGRRPLSHPQGRQLAARQEEEKGIGRAPPRQFGDPSLLLALHPGFRLAVGIAQGLRVAPRCHGAQDLPDAERLARAGLCHRGAARVQDVDRGPRHPPSAEQHRPRQSRHRQLARPGLRRDGRLPGERRPHDLRPHQPPCDGRSRRGGRSHAGRRAPADRRQLGEAAHPAALLDRLPQLRGAGHVHQPRCRADRGRRRLAMDHQAARRRHAGIDGGFFRRQPVARSRRLPRARLRRRGRRDAGRDPGAVLSLQDRRRLRICRRSLHRATQRRCRQWRQATRSLRDAARRFRRALGARAAVGEVESAMRRN